MNYEELIGKRVKPAPAFDFDNFFGPKDADDVGTITAVQTNPDYELEEGFTFKGVVHVRWDSDPEDTSDHTFGELDGIQRADGSDDLKEYAKAYGVVLAE